MSEIRSRYIEMPRPYENGYGAVESELTFRASDRRRAAEHRAAAIELATLYGVEWRTPWRLTPGWTVYREITEGTPAGRPDDRRVIVTAPARALARYLAALPRVLAELEAAATRAARSFGRWRRSLLATLSGALDYEDPNTLRVRAREFRTAVLRQVVGHLRTPPAPASSDPRRPMWEQAAAVAAEVWTDRPVDPWAVTEEEVTAVLASIIRPQPVVIIEAEPDEQHHQDHEDEATEQQPAPVAPARRAVELAPAAPARHRPPHRTAAPRPGPRRARPRIVPHRTAYGSISTPPRQPQQRQRPDTAQAPPAPPHRAAHPSTPVATPRRKAAPRDHY
ncbi:hypothetical protein ABT391_34415 [Streptomyces jumonjinensis]